MQKHFFLSRILMVCAAFLLCLSPALVEAGRKDSTRKRGLEAKVLRNFRRAINHQQDLGLSDAQVKSIQNLKDATLKNLAKQALSHARAGADMVAPSGMMDGMIRTLRESLDEAGFYQLPVMSYAVKYSSAFYGPFRDAADSAPSFGDRRTYQMDPANRREAFREADFDKEEGADILMVKPALSYLDIIRDLRNHYNVPVACYNVSGEYAMVKAAAGNGWIDEKKIVLELLTAITRAGADTILTYHALDAARWLEEAEA